MKMMKIMKIMKLGIRLLGIFAIVGILTIFSEGSFCNSLQGQSFIVSNLDQPNVQNSLVNSTFLASTSFTTGSEDTQLNSIVTWVSNFDGGDDFVEIWNSDSNQPGTSYATFQDDPEDLGSNEFRFLPNGDVSLSANTTYWVVFRGVEFNHRYTTSTAETGNAGWEIGDSLDFYTAQTSWGPLVEPGAIQFGIEIIPEPSEYVLMSTLAIGIFIFIKRKRQTSTS